VQKLSVASALMVVTDNAGTLPRQTDRLSTVEDLAGPIFRVSAQPGSRNAPSLRWLEPADVEAEALSQKKYDALERKQKGCR